MELTWTELSDYRDEIGASVRSLPVIHQRETISYLQEVISPESQVLEIGAHDKSLQEEISFGIFEYRSMDVDPSYDHDFYSLHEVEGKFDVVIMLDVIEHLSFDEMTSYLERIDDCLVSQGKLILQHPNIFALGSNQFYDVMHKQHWPFYDLYALLRYHGYRDIDMYRLDNLLDLQEKPSWKRILRKWFRQFFVKWFGNGLDFAPNILTIARK